MIEEATMTTATRYVFDNASPHAGRRFTALEAIFDSGTIRHLESIGVGDGWACLEVGGGGGSVAQWLSDRVGAAGRVTVTDIDPSWLGSETGPNMEVLRHDIATDALPEAAFDLIHARLVLIHLPQRDAALRRIVSALRPGGWILLEDFDCELLANHDGGVPDGLFGAPLTPTMSDTDMRTLGGAMSALWQVMTARGVDFSYGRRLYGLLRTEGLVDVQAEGFLAIREGGSAMADLHLANLDHLRHDILSLGVLTAEELDRARAILADPRSGVVSPGIMVSARGRRP